MILICFRPEIWSKQEIVINFGIVMVKEVTLSPFLL